MINKCDMCGAAIEDGKCSCGTWAEKGELNDHPFEIAIKYFHAMEKMVCTGEAPHLGCAYVFFRGDYNDCEAIIEFICKRKQRPFYKHTV